MAREFYPTGQVTLNGSTLVQADKFNMKPDNALQLKATLANPNGTPVTGMRSVEVSWDMLIDNNGPEVDAIAAVNEGRIDLIGFKFPAQNVNTTCRVAWASATVAQSLGDACIVSCMAKGHVEDTTGI